MKGINQQKLMLSIRLIKIKYRFGEKFIIRSSTLFYVNRFNLRWPNRKFRQIFRHLEMCSEITWTVLNSFFNHRIRTLKSNILRKCFRAVFQSIKVNTHKKWANATQRYKITFLLDCGYGIVVVLYQCEQ